MNADAHFIIGKTHTVCQDYAICSPLTDKQLVGRPKIIVCDGCSTGIDTDIGSRLIAKAIQQWEGDFCDATVEYLKSLTKMYQNILRLPPDTFLSTVVAAQNIHDFYQIMVSGDGVFALRERKTGKIIVYSFEVLSGAPFYLVYNNREQDVKTYLDKFGYDMEVTIYTIDKAKITSKKEHYEWVSGWNGMFTFKFPLSDYDMVALFSDGVRSFMEPVKSETSKTFKPVPLTDVIQELLAFKNYNGSFVHRRVKRAFEQGLGNFAIKEWFNTDDLAQAVIMD
jgi:hypothetical protein